MFDYPHSQNGSSSSSSSSSTDHGNGNGDDDSDLFTLLSSSSSSSQSDCGSEYGGEDDAPGELETFNAVAECVTQVLNGEECKYVNPLDFLREWFVKNYIDHYRPGDGEDVDGGQSFCCLVWLACVILQSSMETGTATRRAGRRRWLDMSYDDAWDLVDKHTFSYESMHAWRVTDERKLADVVMNLPQNKPYVHMLDRLTQISYLNSLWMDSVCGGERKMEIHEYTATGASASAACKLEHVLASYLRSYEIHEDSDSKFVANGRDIVTRVLCEAGSSILFASRNSRNIADVSQVRPVDALLAVWDDTKSRKPELFKRKTNEIYEQLCINPGDMDCLDRVIGGWLLHVFSLKMHMAEIEHSTAFVESGGQRFMSKMERRRRIGNVSRFSAPRRVECNAASAGSFAHKSEFMRNHVITNYDWGHGKTSTDELAKHGLRRPRIVQFRDRWFVVDYIGATVLDCGRDDRKNGTGCVLSLYVWTELMTKTGWFKCRLANGASIPDEILKCIN